MGLVLDANPTHVNVALDLVVAAIVLLILRCAKLRQLQLYRRNIRLGIKTRPVVNVEALSELYAYVRKLRGTEQYAPSVAVLVVGTIVITHILHPAVDLGLKFSKVNIVDGAQKLAVDISHLTSAHVLDPKCRGRAENCVATIMNAQSFCERGIDIGRLRLGMRLMGGDQFVNYGINAVPVVQDLVGCMSKAPGSASGEQPDRAAVEIADCHGITNTAHQYILADAGEAGSKCLSTVEPNLLPPDTTLVDAGGTVSTRILATFLDNTTGVAANGGRRIEITVERDRFFRALAPAEEEYDSSQPNGILAELSFDSLIGLGIDGVVVNVFPLKDVNGTYHFLGQVREWDASAVAIYVEAREVSNRTEGAAVGNLYVYGQMNCNMFEEGASGNLTLRCQRDTAVTDRVIHLIAEWCSTAECTRTLSHGSVDQHMVLENSRAMTAWGGVLISRENAVSRAIITTRIMQGKDIVMLRQQKVVRAQIEDSLIAILSFGLGIASLFGVSAAWLWYQSRDCRHCRIPVSAIDWQLLGAREVMKRLEFEGQAKPSKECEYGLGIIRQPGCECDRIGITTDIQPLRAGRKIV